MARFIQRGWEGGNSCCFKPYCVFCISPWVRSKMETSQSLQRHRFKSDSEISFKQVTTVQCMPSSNWILKINNIFILKWKSPWSSSSVALPTHLLCCLCWSMSENMDGGVWGQFGAQGDSGPKGTSENWKSLKWEESWGEADLEEAWRDHWVPSLSPKILP